MIKKHPLRNDNGTVRLLTGLPRSGTTLCCHILNSCNNTLALNEPLSPSDFDAETGSDAALKKIKQFISSARLSVREQNTVLTRQRNGKIPDNPVAQLPSSNGLRPVNISLGHIDVSERHLNSNFNLVIKHNAFFTALLPALSVAFPVYGVIRNPLSVLASWNSVDLPVNRGRIPAGEQYSTKLKNKLDRENNKIERQLIIMEWFFSQFANTLGRDRIVKYEEVVTNAATLPKLLGLPSSNIYDKEGRPIPRKSRNNEYDSTLMAELYQRLRGYGDAIWQFYSRDDIDALYQEVI